MRTKKNELMNIHRENETKLYMYICYLQSPHQTVNVQMAILLAYTPKKVIFHPILSSEVIR